MALDTTVGGPTTNSYLTVAEADAYMLARPFSSAWTGADSAKEAALIQAARLLDAMFVWLGEPVNQTQRRAFPRSGLEHNNGTPVLTDDHPWEIEEAQAELAFLLIQSDPTVQSDAALQGLSSLKAGPVELKWRDDISKIVSGLLVPDSVKALIPQSWYMALVTDPPSTEKRMIFENIQSCSNPYRPRRIGGNCP